MKSLTKLVLILLIASIHCVIVNPNDPIQMDGARRPIVNEVPAPSQWIGLNDFLQISKAGRLGDIDPKSISAQQIIRQARQRKAQFMTQRRPSNVPTFEELGIKQDEMIADTEKMLGMQGLHNMKMSQIDWDKVAKKIESLPKTVQSTGPSNIRGRLLLFNFYKLCAFVFAAFCIALIVLIIIAL